MSRITIGMFALLSGSLGSLPAFSQARPAAPKPAAAKPKPPAKAAPKPAATPAAPAPAAPAAPPAASPAAGGAEPVAAKGFARVEVTPAYKEQFNSEMRVAIVVAPSYRGTGLSLLRFTVADTVELKMELERQGYKVWQIGPAEASSDYVRKILKDSKQLIDGSNQATLLFAFSGHGFQTKEGRNYLMTTGASVDKVEQEALALDEVQELMAATGARRKVVLIDACRNDPEAKAAVEARSMTDFKEAEGTSVLLSTRPGGFSYEDADVGHGIFTYYILEGLRGKAAGKDGYVTFYDLQKYVEKSVLDHAMKKDRVQKPFAKGERSGDFLLATAAPPKPEEVKPAASAASKVDADTLVLREVGSTRAFFAKIQGSRLTLVDTKTFVPIADLEEKDAAGLSEGYRRFGGNATNRDQFDVAAEIKGEDILTVKGRIGTPCPGDRACSAPNEVPLLPGEKQKFEDVRNTAATVTKTARVLRENNPFKKKPKTESTETGALAAQKGLDSTNPLLMFHWKSFNLTTNLPSQAKAQ